MNLETTTLLRLLLQLSLEKFYFGSDLSLDLINSLRRLLVDGVELQLKCLSFFVLRGYLAG